MFTSHRKCTQIVAKRNRKSAQGENCLAITYGAVYIERIIDYIITRLSVLFHIWNGPLIDTGRLLDRGAYRTISFWGSVY